MKRELRPSSVAFAAYPPRPGIQRTLSQSVAYASDLIGAHSSYSGGHGSNIHGPGIVGGLRGIAEGSTDMEKIKKVQSFFRGWLCRRRWKQIVEQYIKSPHAESMRKRNRY